MTAAVPERILARFRAQALERIERVESGWAHVTQASDLDIAAIEHELHALRGEARMLGYGDVTLLCHKLGELVDRARQRRLDVPHDLDLVVTMALRFTAMLVRRRAGQDLGGIDLAGLIEQIDEVLQEAATEPAAPRRRSGGSPPAAADGTPGPLPEAIGQRLGVAACEIFLARLGAGPAIEARLRAAWDALAAELDAVSRAAADAAEVSRDLEVWHFTPVGGPRWAVPASWRIRDLVPAAEAHDAVDPLDRLGLPRLRSPELAVVLERDGERLLLLADEEPTAGLAERRCPTTADHPVEIATVDQVDTLLIRPDRLTERDRGGG
jgi:hypothetical protein